MSVGESQVNMPSPQESEPYKRQFPHVEHRALEVSSSRLAGEFFIRASGEFPASAIVQAVRVQQLCRAADKSALDLGQALEHDQEELERITAIANNAHQSALDENAKSSAPYEITPEKALYVIRHVFAFAALLHIASHQELDVILTDFYPKFLANKAQRGNNTAEKILNHEVLEYLRTKLGIAQLLLQGAARLSADPRLAE